MPNNEFKQSISGFGLLAEDIIQMEMSMITLLKVAGCISRRVISVEAL